MARALYEPLTRRAPICGGGGASGPGAWLRDETLAQLLRSWAERAMDSDAPAERLPVRLLALDCLIA